MKWYEKQPLLLESTVGQQLPELAFSNKGALVLADVLAHPKWSRCMDSLLSKNHSD